MESSRFVETISLKATFPKSLLVKNLENEEKLAYSNRFVHTVSVIDFAFDCFVDFSQRRQ